jgi:hypothetical protein
MSRLIDLVEKRFGRLIVLSYRGSNKRGHSFWVCKCDCGGMTIVRRDQLIRGETKSCGCLKAENKSPIRIKHGLYKSREYSTYVGIKDRCYNKNNNKYRIYGARGIKVCDHWLKSFENFYEDMGPRPKEMSIERIDNNGYYSPGNCKWATNYEQNRNTRRNHWFSYGGKKMILEDWVRLFQVNISSVCYHLKKGHSFDEIVEIFRNSKRVKWNGEGL